EPRRGLADLALDDGADVIHGARHIAEHDGGRPPKRDEREHHAADDDNLRSAIRRLARGRALGRSDWSRHERNLGTKIPKTRRGAGSLGGCLRGEPIILATPAQQHSKERLYPFTMAW